MATRSCNIQPYFLLTHQIIYIYVNVCLVQKLHVPCLSLPEQSTYPVFTVTHDAMCSTHLHVILIT